MEPARLNGFESIYKFQKSKDPPELLCGCIVVSQYVVTGTAGLWVEVKILGRCVKFGCAVRTIATKSKWHNEDIGRTSNTTLARRADPLALALLEEL